MDCGVHQWRTCTVCSFCMMHSKHKVRLRSSRHVDQSRYLNNVSERRQCEPPPPFYGGILSDHMGLGKSLSMIALMALDKNESSMGNTGIGSPALGGSTNTSLVVMPSSC